jgi:hypothetical protein
MDGAALAPNRIQDFVARDDAADVFDQQFKNTKFGLGEMDFATIAEGSERGDIQGEASEFENVPAAELVAADQGADAGEKFLKGERLCEVVVGPGIEAAHDIVKGIAGGKHQDGRFLFPLAEQARYLESAHAGQHDVEENNVEGLGGREFECRHAVPGMADLVLLLAQATGEQSGHFRFVFYNENSHTLYREGEV